VSEGNRLPWTGATFGTNVGRQLLLAEIWGRRHTIIAAVTLACIIAYMVLNFILAKPDWESRIPLWIALSFGGIPLVIELLLAMFRAEFGSDLLAGISIVTAILLGEYLAGSIVVLMLSGGAALESFAVKKASSVLDSLASRMPSTAHRSTPEGIVQIPISQIGVGDRLVVMPHESCPVDGVVVEGRGNMDEAYLTGEPYKISKSIGSSVLSGAVNGESVLTIQATRLPVDSRYARIMRVMEQSQQQRPRMRRLADQLGAFYTPLAVSIAVGAWLFSGEAIRFLAVLVVATPCPLLIAIPVSIIGSISLSARRGIIIRDPAVLEKISNCRTMIFDKTGTLTYGQPKLIEQHVSSEFSESEVLQLASSLEQYSKHPLAQAVIDASKQAEVNLLPAETVMERPGEGLRGRVENHEVEVTSRGRVLSRRLVSASQLPVQSSGLECVIVIDGRYAATYQFRDAPRAESVPFIEHLAPRHGFDKLMLLSGDRQSEVEYLAQLVGISEMHAGKSPEEKLAIVRLETQNAPTVYVGDGINDAPAMLAATVGLALGQHSDVTSQAAGAVLMNNKLGSVDELLHIGSRMRRIALQSAVGGMALSLLGMSIAAAGYLPPVAGAVFQEFIDVFAVLNALRTAWMPGVLQDYHS
jgi:heavy metal translocating P-type ATPase